MGVCPKIGVITSKWPLVIYMAINQHGEVPKSHIFPIPWQSKAQDPEGFLK